MFTTIFYSPLLPISLLYTAIGLGLYYHVLKFILFNVRGVKENIGSKIAEEVVELLELMIPLYSVSNIIMNFLLSDTDFDTKEGVFGVIKNLILDNPYAMIGIIIGVLHALLPMDKVNNYFFKNDDDVVIL